MSTIATLADLKALYGQPSDPAVVKEIDRLVPAYQAMIEASPFVALATNGPDGLDCSPRGDAGSVVRVADAKTVLLPDRRGNNRIDSLRNIVHDPHVALLFLIPGSGNTMRVQGRAVLRADLWNAEKHVDPKALPSAGTMLAQTSDGRIGGADYDMA